MSPDGSQTTLIWSFFQSPPYLMVSFHGPSNSVHTIHFLRDLGQCFMHIHFVVGFPQGGDVCVVILDELHSRISFTAICCGDSFKIVSSFFYRSFTRFPIPNAMEWCFINGTRCSYRHSKYN